MTISLNESSPNFLATVYTRTVRLFATGAALAGLFLLGKQDTLGAVIAFAGTILLFWVAWAFGKRRNYRIAFGAHLGAIALGAGLIGYSIIESAGGKAFNSLRAADGLVLIACSLVLGLVLRTLYKMEHARDKGHNREMEMMLRRFFKGASARVGLFLLTALILIVYLMPRLDPYTRDIALRDGDLNKRLGSPDCVIGYLRTQQGLNKSTADTPATSLFDIKCEHPFGFDQNGRDIMRRVLHGISTSLAVSVIAVVISLMIGATIGLVAGFFGGRLDALLMRSMDIMLAFPALLLAIAIVAMRGPGLDNAMIAIGVVGIPSYARLARSMAISLRNFEFVTAARSLGAGQGHLLRHHILPNSLAPLIVQSTLGLGTAVIETAALGYLGLGQQPPLPELGKMLAESREVLVAGMWWVMVFPGLAVIMIVLSFNLLGDALRDTLDPRLRGS